MQPCFKVLASKFVTAIMCFFSENGRNPSSCHLFLSCKPGTHRVILMTFAAVGLPCKPGGTPIQSKRCYHFLFTPGRRQKGEEAPNFSLTVLVSSQYVYDFSFGTNYYFTMLYYNRVETDCNNTMVIISTRKFSNFVFMFV